ncbi:hypothetical protein [Sphingobacterium hungaricum]
MKKASLLIAVLAYACNLVAQIHEPQILVLAPKEFKYDKVFESEVKEKSKELSKFQTSEEMLAYSQSDEFKSQPENMQIIALAQIEFNKDLDFSKRATMIAQSHLTYRFFERFPNLLILPTKIESGGSVVELKRISDDAKMQYVLNFSKITLYKKQGIGFATISVQLYDQASQSLLINADYEGDWFSQGFEFGCENESIDCPINNALSQILENVVLEVASNSPALKKDKELALLRLEELKTSYLSKPYDKDFLKSVLPHAGEDINLDDQYQILIDPSQTKFVAFLLNKRPIKILKSLQKATRTIK